MKKAFKIALLLTVLFTLGACANKEKAADTPVATDTAKTDAATPTAEATPTTTTEEIPPLDPNFPKTMDELPQFLPLKDGDTIATLKTTKGDIKLRLFPEVAPKAVENFTKHATDGYYDNLIFHRVIANFVIQGGDPMGTGEGGESIFDGGKDFDSEISNEYRHFTGALAMANRGPNTNGSQFYIVCDNPLDLTDIATLKNPAETIIGKDPQGKIWSYQEYLFNDDESKKYNPLFPQPVIDAYEKVGGHPELDYKYTVFGQVLEGQDVVDAIALSPRDGNDKPIEDIKITGIDVSTYKAE
ncbi:hypothetical protein AGMMS49975_06770 [Clostridia bacterium]|nr:hypothetical protein AGMMS49975_06770 [Clostridia bacterium]GHU73898.1 hypothetical protein FACS1894188_00610 [Clostridia bacterium]